MRKDLFFRESLVKLLASRKGFVSAIKGALLLRDLDDPSLELPRLMIEMSAWVCEDNTAVVRYRFYMLMTIVLAGVDGVATSLILENWFIGVDPFNIAVYAWAFTTFFTLVTKSIELRDCTWADFLRGRAVCSSVSELSSITGCSEQQILAKLLHDQKDSALVTRGPYNSTFERRTGHEDDAFSIDIPATTRTLLLGGLAMLEGRNPIWPWTWLSRCPERTPLFSCSSPWYWPQGQLRADLPKHRSPDAEYQQQERYR